MTPQETTESEVAELRQQIDGLSKIIAELLPLLTEVNEIKDRLAHLDAHLVFDSRMGR